MSTYETRALEVHDFARIWNLTAMRRRLRFMVANDLNTLVLHEPGIVDKVVFPAIYLGGKSVGRNLFEIARQIDENILKYAIREFQNAFRHKYLVRLIEEAREAGIAVYLEDKELWFKDFLLKDHPEAFNRGFFCPSKSFWWEEFLPAKYTELFVALPGLAGVVTSFGTGETRLALGNIGHCGCTDCQALDTTAWHRNMALGMHRPFQAAGKKLVLRDFIFQRRAHDEFARALTHLPPDIVIAMKNTPHDFYPTFPHNPLIGQVGNREQWIEYDVHGQYFGWGVAPSIMTDDIAARLAHGRQHKVRGFILRTDWEGTQDHSCFETPNLVNLYAATTFARKPATTKREIYARWLEGEGLLENTLSAARRLACAAWAEHLLEQTWPIMRGAVFLNGTVFSDSGTFHVYLRQSTWIAETLHSLKDWKTDADTALQMKEANAVRVLAEKAEAVRRATALHCEAAKANPGLKPAAYADLVWHLEFLRWYAEGFNATTRVYVFAQLADATNEPPVLIQGESPLAMLRTAIDDLRAYRDRVHAAPIARAYPANALLDPDRLGCFIADAEQRLLAGSPAA